LTPVPTKNKQKGEKSPETKGDVPCVRPPPTNKKRKENGEKKETPRTKKKEPTGGTWGIRRRNPRKGVSMKQPTKNHIPKKKTGGGGTRGGDARESTKANSPEPW